MDETPGNDTPKTASRTRRKSPAKRATTSPARRRAPARKKTVPRTRRSPGGAGLEGMLRAFVEKANLAGATIAAISGEGVVTARRALGSAGTASKSTIDKLAREWKQMDGRRRAQFAAALFAALAAASAPIVRSKLKKR